MTESLFPRTCNFLETTNSIMICVRIFLRFFFFFYNDAANGTFELTDINRQTIDQLVVCGNGLVSCDSVFRKFQYITMQIPFLLINPYYTQNGQNFRIFVILTTFCLKCMLNLEFMSHPNFWGDVGTYGFVRIPSVSA